MVVRQWPSSDTCMVVCGTSDDPNRACLWAAEVKLLLERLDMGEIVGLGCVYLHECSKCSVCKA